MAFINENNAWLVILLIILFFTAITVVFYYRLDKYEPEPLNRIILGFIYGLIAIIPALIVELIIQSVIGSNLFINSAIIAPIVEEFCKGLFVLLLAKNESFDGPLDGLVYGAMVGAGFAAGENLLYAVSLSASSGFQFGITLTTLRSLSQIIGHPLYTSITGVGIGEAKVGLSANKFQQIWRAILLHGMWNASSAIPDFGFYLGLLIVIVTSIYLLRNELKLALNLDEKAFNLGYYDMKKQVKMNRFRGINQNNNMNPPPMSNFEEEPDLNQRTNSDTLEYNQDTGDKEDNFGE